MIPYYTATKRGVQEMWWTVMGFHGLRRTRRSAAIGRRTLRAACDSFHPAKTKQQTAQIDVQSGSPGSNLFVEAHNGEKRPICGSAPSGFFGADLVSCGRNGCLLGLAFLHALFSIAVTPPSSDDHELTRRFCPAADIRPHCTVRSTVMT